MVNLVEPDKNMVALPQVLYTILKLSGIKCKENPTLIAWKTQLGVERRIIIHSVEQLMKVFGPGLYQVYVKNPEVSGIDPETFKIKSLSITIAYEGKGKWGEPFIQTDEEEISPEYANNFNKLAKERSIKIALKIKDVIVTIIQLSKIGVDSGVFD